MRLPIFCEKPVGIIRLLLVVVILLSFVSLVDAQDSDLDSMGGSQDWWSQVHKDISEREYHVREVDHAMVGGLKDCRWQGPNRRQNLSVYFSENGPRVVPKSTDKDQCQWTWGLELIGYPKVDKTHVEDNRIEFERSGGLVEWYVNDERGVEQGFTLETPSTDQVTLDLAVQGDLTPKLSLDGKVITFSSEKGVDVLTYSGLKAWDATGLDLPATMSLYDEVIRLSVDATGAVYPVVIDPVVSRIEWGGESDQANAHYGFSVSTAGDVNGDGFDDVIVGSPRYDNGGGDEGAAFVYHGSASGLSSYADWVMKGTRFNTRFGYSVSTAGDVNGDGYSDVIIGAPWHEDGNTTRPYISIYHGSQDGLSVIPAWVMDANQEGSKFGYTVACAGDLNGDGFDDVIVGEPEYDNPGELHEGRVRVYYGSQQGVSMGIGWLVEGNQQEARFGNSVASAGDVNGDGYDDVMIGSEWYSNGDLYEGKVFVYYGSEAGLTYTLNWWAEGNEAGVRFGHSVSSAGDVNQDGFDDVVIGSPYCDFDSTDEGCVFVYYGSDQGLENTADWVRQGVYENGCFGSSVACAGDVNADGFDDIIIGEPYDGVETGVKGSSYVYHGSSMGVQALGASKMEYYKVDTGFAYSVSSAGDVNGDGCNDVIIGSYKASNGDNNEGTAYIYYGIAMANDYDANWMAEGNTKGAKFGCSVADAGDVNGDGYDDVIVGAPLYGPDVYERGAAFVYYGSQFGLSFSCSWMVEGSQEGERFGSSVSTAGDINNDGFDDVIIGSIYYSLSDTVSNVGAVSVYYGSETGLSEVPDWTKTGTDPYDYFGCDVSLVGDGNGDGYDDIIIGSYSFDNGQNNEGAAYIYNGSESGLSLSANWMAEGNEGDSFFGYSVSNAGDVNGDGFDDVIIGAFANGDHDEGAAYVYHGSESGIETVAAWTVHGEPWSDLGIVSTAGDVNNDGYSDVIVGAPGYNSNKGKAFVYHGSEQGLSSVESWSVEGSASNAYYGGSVSSVGDVNNDGYSDIIITESFAMTHQTGYVYIYLGSESGIQSSYSWMLENEIDYNLFPGCVSSVGDVNNDGYSDFIIGASGFSGDYFGEGAAFVYYGPQYNMKYTAGDNGTLHGMTLQSAWSGSSGYPVEAVADNWYRFVGWSDGSTDNPRLDENVTENIDVIAIFEFDPSSAWMLH